MLPLIFPLQDTAPPKMVYSNMSLWDLGSNFLAAGHEIGYLAQQGAAANVANLTLNRFYLFVRENGPGALQQGYLHILNVITLKAQEVAGQTRILLVALLVVELVALAAGGFGYMVVLLRAVAQCRAALFTVFLFVPSGLLRSLASKSVVVADLDDEGAQRKKRAASAAGKSSTAGGASMGFGDQASLMGVGGGAMSVEGGASGLPRASADLGAPRKRVSVAIKGGSVGGGGRPSIGNGNVSRVSFGIDRPAKGVGFSIEGNDDAPRMPRRHVSIQLDTAHDMHDGDGGGNGNGNGGDVEDVDVFLARTRPSPAVGGGGGNGGVVGGSELASMLPFGRASIDSAAKQVIARLEDKSFSGTYKRQISGEIDLERNIFNSKQITDTGRDVYKLLWPFVAWIALVMMAYIISIFAFQKFPADLNNIKMMQRTIAQTSRVTFYASRLALGGPTDSNATKTAMQLHLASETTWLDVVYRTALYGGGTLNDSYVDGSHDNGDGSLFAQAQNAYIVFMAVGCIRVSSDVGGTPWGPPCANTSSPLYQVSRHAIDPMLRRHVSDAELMSLDDLVALSPSSSRWFYIWSIARVDLIDGLTTLAADLESDTTVAFSTITLLQIVMVVCVVVIVAVYLIFFFRPFLTASFEESKRVAELLAQVGLGDRGPQA